MQMLRHWKYVSPHVRRDKLQFGILFEHRAKLPGNKRGTLAGAAPTCEGWTRLLRWNPTWSNTGISSARQVS
ncbi:MAG: hypothetical protein ACLTDF_08435 [Coprococcus sp.]